MNKGYDFRDAVDGQDGVNVYRDDGPFEYVMKAVYNHPY